MPVQTYITWGGKSHHSGVCRGQLWHRTWLGTVSENPSIPSFMFPYLLAVMLSSRPRWFHLHWWRWSHDQRFQKSGHVDGLAGRLARGGSHSQNSHTTAIPMPWLGVELLGPRAAGEVLNKQKLEWDMGGLPWAWACWACAFALRTASWLWRFKSLWLLHLFQLGIWACASYTILHRRMTTDLKQADQVKQCRNSHCAASSADLAFDQKGMSGYPCLSQVPGRVFWIWLAVQTKWMNTKTRVHPCNCALQESSQALPRNGLFIVTFLCGCQWNRRAMIPSRNCLARHFAARSVAPCGTVWHRLVFPEVGAPQLAN